VPGTADSWNHEKESAWLYDVVAGLLGFIQPRHLRPVLALDRLLGARLS